MKNKILIPLFVLGALAAFFSFKYVRAGSRSSQDKRQLVIETVMKAIQLGHYSPRALDDTFSTRVYNRMVTAFDGEKLFFTQQDVNTLKKYEFLIDDEIKANSTEFFDSLDAIFIRRIAATDKYYQELLKTPFTFTSEEVLNLTPEKNQYAANDNALNDKWRLYLKYRVLVKYVDVKSEQDKKKENKDSVNVKMKTDTELEAKAREDVMKSNQRYFKRLNKTKDDDRFTFYVNALTETEDPHTAYFPPAQKTQFDEQMSGSFVGIGARLNQPDNEKTTVASIITGSPSGKQGELKAGDEIQKVAQGDKEPVDISGYDIDDVVKLIRGPKGTEVRLTVKNADGAIKVIPIIRGVVELEDVFAKSAIIQSKNGPVGFIYLPEFYADFNHTSGRTCATDVAEEVKKMKAAGVTGIILDLRYNGGGSLGDVVEMASIFLGKGPVVQVKSGHASPSILRSRTYDTALYTGPLAIMVNQNSASASEILAAVLQDYRRAVIVGATTYGKGTVQKMVSLDDMVDPLTRLNMMNDTTGSGGSIGAVKLTMEKFYRVNGGSTQLKGVTPDIEMPDQFDGYDDEELGERHNKSALAWDEIPAASYKQTNSVGNIKSLAKMSESRINSNPTFQLISENAKIIKAKRDDNKVSLNEKEYKKEQEEINATSKKLETLQKSAVTLDLINAPADLARVNADTASVTKNKDWLKALSKDIYISETVNIINDLKKSNMKMDMGTGMK